MRRIGIILSLAALAGLAAFFYTAPRTEANPKDAYRSPFDIAYSPDGKLLAVSDRTAANVSILNGADGKVQKQVALNGDAMGVAWLADGSKLFVAEYTAGTVAEVDPNGGQVTRHIKTGAGPVGVAVASKRKLLLVANSHIHTVSVIGLADGKEIAAVPVKREPYFLAVTPDENTAVVGNLLPLGNAMDGTTAAAVSILDLQTNKVAAEVQLPGGSTNVRKVAISPDGAYAYTVHTLGRTTLPTSQLERGWVNTNALTVIDLAKKQIHATVLLDRLSEGAANPWGVALAKDGKTLWITISGIHQVARVEVERMNDYLAGKLPEDKDPIRPRVPSIWFEIKTDAAKRPLLANDLAALYGPGLITRTRLDCNGPRGIDVSPDGKTLAIASYYTGQVLLVDAQTHKVQSKIALGPQREPDQVRKGEIAFHDASCCFQHWLSCATCHPEGRVDGLNWDLLNDGIGNPKNARSMLLADKTPPVMSLGVRDTMETAVKAGYRFIQFHEPTEELLRETEAYIRALKPEKSPYLLPDGSLSPKAQQGKAIFAGKANCATCHPAPLYTDLKKYDVDSKCFTDRTDTAFDNPTLIEIWRTAPYMHSGEAATLHELFTKFNKNDKHGTTSKLSKEELDALVEFLLSL